MPFIVSSVTSTEFLNVSPPCSTRWPQAPISSREEIAPLSLSVSADRTAEIASVWSFMLRVNSITLSVPSTVCLKCVPSMPMRSTRPFALTDSSSMSMSWNFSEEEPALMTKIFMGSISLLRMMIRIMAGKTRGRRL